MNQRHLYNTHFTGLFRLHFRGRMVLAQVNLLEFRYGYDFLVMMYPFSLLTSRFGKTCCIFTET